MAKGKKINFMKVVQSIGVSAGTGAIVQVVSEVVAATNQDYVDYGILAVGVILPEVVKGNEMVNQAGAAMVAIAGYKLAEKYDISGKLGITPATAVKGMNDFKNVGNAGGWNSQARPYQAQKVQGTKFQGKTKSEKSAQVM